MTTIREEIPIAISYKDLMTCTASAKTKSSSHLPSRNTTNSFPSTLPLLRSQIDTAIKQAFSSDGLGLIIVKDIFPSSSSSNHASTDTTTNNVPSPLQTSFERLLPIGSYSMAFPSVPMNEYVQKLKTVGLGTDVPVVPTASSTSSTVYPRTASVACQLSWEKDSSLIVQPTATTDGIETSSSITSGDARSVTDHSSYSVQHLSTDMHNVGQLMVQICSAIASSCDRIYNLYPRTLTSSKSLMETSSSSATSSFPGILESALVDAQTAKARLIHYYAAYHSTKSPSSPFSSSNHSHSSDAIVSSSQFASLGDWQNWHFDYGLFTALANPTYLYHEPTEDGSTDGNVKLVEGNNTDGGLIVLRPTIPTSLSAFPYPEPHPSCSCTKVESVLVHIPKNAIAIQVGEAAQILSNGLLVATAHCVHRPFKIVAKYLPSLTVDPAWFDRISRQIFVVFCQPPWKLPLRPHSNDNDADMETESVHEKYTNLEQSVLQASQLTTKVLLGECECRQSIRSCSYCNNQRILPPLRERWKYGDTYTDLSKKTTKAYFGTKGVQNQKTKK